MHAYTGQCSTRTTAALHVVKFSGSISHARRLIMHHNNTPQHLMQHNQYALQPQRQLTSATQFYSRPGAALRRVMVRNMSICVAPYQHHDTGYPVYFSRGRQHGLIPGIAVRVASNTCHDTGHTVSFFSGRYEGLLTGVFVTMEQYTGHPDTGHTDTGHKNTGYPDTGNLDTGCTVCGFCGCFSEDSGGLL